MSESPSQLMARARETRRKMMPVLHRERAKLEQQFGVPFEPFSSVHTGINLPDEGASDIDLNVGVEDPEAFSRILTKAGIPLKDSKKNSKQQILHEYRTPEGYDVEIKIRPTHEVAWQVPGRNRMLRLSAAEKAKIILEKHRLKSSGDQEAYTRYKLGLYEKYKMIPPGGDWSQVDPSDAPGTWKSPKLATGIEGTDAWVWASFFATLSGSATR